jgi:hypothetical protein
MCDIRIRLRIKSRRCSKEDTTLPAGIEEWSAMLPFAALDGGFNGVSRCSIWQHDKSVAKVFMDVSAHKCIHLVTT